MANEINDSQHDEMADMAEGLIEEDESEESEVVRWEPIHKRATRSKQKKKASYEANSDVQRWLKEQSIEPDAKPRFDPSFLTLRRDAPWILSSLTPLYDQDLINVSSV